MISKECIEAQQRALKPTEPGWGQDVSNSLSNDLLASLFYICDTASVLGCPEEWGKDEQLEWYEKRDKIVSEVREYLSR